MTDDLAAAVEVLRQRVAAIIARTYDGPRWQDLEGDPRVHRILHMAPAQVSHPDLAYYRRWLKELRRRMDRLTAHNRQAIAELDQIRRELDAVTGQAEQVAPAEGLIDGAHALLAQAARALPSAPTYRIPQAGPCTEECPWYGRVAS